MAYHSFVKKEVKREDSKSWLNLPTFDSPSSSVPKVEIKPERDVRSITMDNIPRAPFRQDGVPKTDRSVGFNMNNVPQANPGPSTGLQDTCLFTDFFGAVAPRRRNRGRRRAPNQPFTGLCFDCGEKGHRQRMCPIDATRFKLGKVYHLHDPGVIRALNRAAPPLRIRRGKNGKVFYTVDGVERVIDEDVQLEIAKVADQAFVGVGVPGTGIFLTIEAIPERVHHDVETSSTTAEDGSREGSSRPVVEQETKTSFEEKGAVSGQNLVIARAGPSQQRTTTQQLFAPQQTLTPQQSLVPQQSLAPQQPLAFQQSFASQQPSAPQQAFAPQRFFMPPQQPLTPLQSIEPQQSFAPRRLFVSQSPGALQQAPATARFNTARWAQTPWWSSW